MTDATEKKGPSTTLFYWLTGLYVAVIVVGACLLGFFDPTGKPISVSDWGDVLAGVFSPLAFLWLIYASLSQRAELELQRKELKQNNSTQEDQRLAMEKQGEAMKAQATLMAAQAKATYEPIFVVSEVVGSPVSDSYIVVWIENLGSDILNLSPANDVELTMVRKGRLDPSNIRGNFLAHWPMSSRVAVKIELEDRDRHRPLIDLTFQRLDGIRRRLTMAFNKQNRSVELVSSINEPDAA